MALPTIRVEVGFDLSNDPNAAFFRLDDATQGRLDNTTYRLAGVLFYDVTEHVSAVTVNRGKQITDTNYQPGECEIQFNNHNRWFDPLYTASPYNGNIVPRREVKIFANDIEMYRGWIDDWDLTYSNDGDSISIAKAFDAIQILNTRYVFPTYTPVEELSGARINAVLDLPEIAWPSGLRQIDAGQATIAANPITEPVSALEYLQIIASSEPGDTYVTRDGKFAFIDRVKAPSSASFVEFSDNDISFDNLNVSYGAELLFNEVVMTRQGGGTATASEPASIELYGYRTLNITDSQVSTDAQLADIALSYVSKYSRPTYRFDAMDIYLHKLSPENQNRVLALDFGDICKVVFTPNGIGDPIEQFVEVINIDHNIDVEQHTVTLGFSEIVAAALRLDDAIFGKLDENVLAG